jgi:hypothetical protein
MSLANTINNIRADPTTGPLRQVIAIAQGRYWILTIPASTLWSPIGPWNEDVQFMTGQLEEGAGGYLHWQILVAFKKKLRFARVKSYFPKETHLELTRSEAADEYVTKDDTAVPGTTFTYDNLLI